MLPKINRLNLKKEDQRQVFNYKIKTTFSCDFFARKNSEHKFRAAAVVPLGVVKKAVQRNIIRRKLFNIVQQSSITKQNLDLIIMFKQKVKKSSQLNWQRLEPKISQVLEEISAKF